MPIGHERPPAGAGPAGAAPILDLRGIDKWFGDVHANRDVSLTVAEGTIHGIVGENGAGKSTLMGILYGYHRPDRGEIAVRGRPAAMRTPRDALARGIGMVHQHFMLVEPFTVLENVVLGAEGGFRLGAGLARARARARAAGPDVPPRRRPRRARRRPRRGRAPARGDPEGAVPRRRPPDPRRADRRPDACGDRPPLPRPPGPARRGQERPARHAQAARDRRRHRRRHRDAPRRDRRDPAHGGDDGGGPRRADGRPRGAPARRPGARPPPGTWCWRSRISWWRTHAGSRASTA